MRGHPYYTEGVTEGVVGLEDCAYEEGEGSLQHVYVLNNSLFLTIQY